MGKHWNIANTPLSTKPTFSYIANTSALPTPLRSRGKTLISRTDYDCILLHVPLLHQKELNPSCVDTDSEHLTPFLPSFLSAPPSHHRTKEKEYNKDLFLPALPHSLSIFMRYSANHTLQRFLLQIS